MALIFRFLEASEYRNLSDTATCPKGSTAPFHLDDLYKILSLIGEIESKIFNSPLASFLMSTLLTTVNPCGIEYVDTGYTIDPYVHGGLPGHVGANSCFGISSV